MSCCVSRKRPHSGGVHLLLRCPPICSLVRRPTCLFAYLPACLPAQVMADIDFKGKDWNSQIKFGQPGFYGKSINMCCAVGIVPTVSCTAAAFCQQAQVQGSVRPAAALPAAHNSSASTTRHCPPAVKNGHATQMGPLLPCALTDGRTPVPFAPCLPLLPRLLLCSPACCRLPSAHCPSQVSTTSSRSHQTCQQVPRCFSCPSRCAAASASA